MTDHPNRHLGRKGRGKKFWKTLEQEYIKGIGGSDTEEPEWISLDELAAKYGVTGAAVRYHSTPGKWTERRESYKDWRSLDVQVKQLEVKHAEMEKSNSTDISIAKIIKNQTMWLLSKMEELRQGDSKIGLLRFSGLLKRIAEIEQTAQRISRTAYEQPVKFIEERRKVEAELSIRNKKGEGQAEHAVDPVIALLEKAAELEGDAFIKAIEALERIDQARPPETVDAEIVAHAPAALPAHDAASRDE